MAEWEPLFASITESVAQLRTLPLTGGDVSDAAGMCRKVERDLADLRKGWNELIADNTPVPAKEPQQVSQWDKDQALDVGTRFQTKKRSSAKRTYSTASILAGVAAETGRSPMEVLNLAVIADAARINWQWTNLNKFLETHGVDLREHIAKETKVEDDGTIQDVWVGEVWTHTFEQQAIKQEEQTDE